MGCSYPGLVDIGERRKKGYLSEKLNVRVKCFIESKKGEIKSPQLIPYFHCISEYVKYLVTKQSRRKNQMQLII
jgi:hypothetical protein